MKEITPIAGLLTCFVLYFVIIVAAWSYSGEQHEPYSVFNHFISELGSPKFSHHYLLYNVGLICSAVGFGLFARGLGKYSTTRLSRLGATLGVIAAVFCVGVGLVPEDYRVPHLILALSFFTIAAIAVGLFSWNIWRDDSSPFSKYLALHGASVPLLFILFMSMPKDLMAIKREAGPLFIRPDIWWLPFFEWMIFIALTSWMTCLSIKMLQMRRATQSETVVATQNHTTNTSIRAY